MRIEAEESRFIPVDHRIVYNLIADYREGHPRILPPKYFGWLEVVEGGVGAGTRIRFSMKSFGAERQMVASVKEPEPGRVLVESFDDGTGVTTFTVDAHAAGCDVTIRTVLESPGVGGLLARLMAPGFLRRVYREELGLLEEVAKEEAASNLPPND